MPKKAERDPLGFFNIHSVAKQQKKLKGGPIGEKDFPNKSLAVPKKIERGPLGFLNTQSVVKYQRN